MRAGYDSAREYTLRRPPASSKTIMGVDAGRLSFV
jgi:hypothetical protein